MSELKRVVALGFFDGIHLGHAALLEKTVERAKEKGAEPAVVTFDAHPDTFVHGVKVPLIYTSYDRREIIKKHFSIDTVVFMHFDENMMNMRWQKFVDVLIEELNACHLVVGYDFKCGWRGEGSADKLRDYCHELGLGCDIIPVVKYGDEVISSTLLRNLLSDGDVKKANILLGHRYRVIGRVQHGKKLGRTLGTPTINMLMREGTLVPRFGVYATKVFLEDNSEHIGVTNIGTRPTVSGDESVSVETFILDYDGDLYGQVARVEFYDFIRPEQKFSGIDELKQRILADADSSRAYFERCVEL